MRLKGTNCLEEAFAYKGVEVGVFPVAEVGYDWWVEVVLLLVQLVLKIVEDQSSAGRVFDGEGIDPAEVVVEVVVGLSPIVVGDGLELPGVARCSAPRPSTFCMASVS